MSASTWRPWEPVPDDVRESWAQDFETATGRRVVRLVWTWGPRGVVVRAELAPRLEVVEGGAR